MNTPALGTFGNSPSGLDPDHDAWMPTGALNRDVGGVGRRPVLPRPHNAQRGDQTEQNQGDCEAGRQIAEESSPHGQDFPECEQFEGRKRSICRGEVLTREKCLQYRDQWGLPQNPLLLPPAQVTQKSSVLSVTGGPGTELKQLLRMLGIPSDWCESCTQRAATMDRWGVAGCIVHRAEIRRWLLEQQAAASSSTKLSAAWHALRTGSAWQIIRSGDPVEWMIDEALTRAAEIARKRSRPAPVTVVIPCHNYAHFLSDALLSLQASTVQPTQILVLDDASDDDPAAVCDRFGVPCERVEFRDVHQVRRHGLQSVRTKYVLFLDADNVVPADYLDKAVELLEADREAAFVFPVLQGFGQKTGAMYGTGQAPDVLRGADIECRNLCDANSVCRTEVLRSTRALQLSPATRRAQDWRMFRQVLRHGPWHARRSPVALHYRVHPQQATQTTPAVYYQDADLANESVSIVIPFSGRWDAWRPLRNWLLQQTWPRPQTRLIILNGTHRPLSAAGLELQDWDGDLAISRIDAGRPRLADEERRGRRSTVAEVEAAVTGLYNRGLLLCQDEYVLTLEDDVIPQRLDAIERLMQQMGPRVAAVSGVYRHRYQERACAFPVPWGSAPMLPLDGPEIDRVGGTGFGCLLLRRSVVSRYGLSGDDARRPHYDVDIASRLAADGWEWILDRGVRCEHLIGGPTPGS